jgi:TonB dependent receptor
MRGLQFSIVRALVAVVFSCICSAMLHADQPTGTIRLSVAAAVAGPVLIDISSDIEPTRHWRATIDATHPATVAGLPPAAYRVVAAITGKGTITHSLDLAAAEVAWLRISTDVASDALTIAVVERDPQGELTRFGPRDLHTLPVGGSVDSLIETAAPFAVVDAIDGGGLEVSRSRLVGNRGSSGRQSTLRLGDIELMQRPGAGVAALVPDASQLETVVVSYGLATPDLASAGADITLVPRRPGPRFAGAADASFTSSGMVSTNDGPTAPAVEALRSWRNVNLQFGSPLSEHTSLFVSEALTSGRKVEGGRPGATPIGLSSTFAHAIADLTSRDQLRLVGITQGLRHEFDGRTQFDDRAATERVRVSHVQAAWEHQLDDGSRGEVSIALQQGSFKPEIPSTLGGTIDRIFDGVVPPAAAASTASRTDARLLFEPRERSIVVGSHALQFGLLVSHSTSFAQIVAAPPVTELVGGLPARVWVRTAPDSDSRRHVNSTSAYVSDRIGLSAQLTLDLGLGLGRSSGSAGTPASSADWATVLPRVSFRWAPKGLSIFGGYSGYQPALSLDDLAFGDPGEAAVRVYRWDDLNGNRRPDPGEARVLIAQAGRNPDVASIAPALRAPRTRELTFGLERRLARTSLIRATATIRNEDAVLRSVNVGAPASSYVALTLPDQGEDYLSTVDDRLLTVYDRLPASFGQDRFVLMNDTDREHYGGIELTYVLNTARLTMMFGAMAYHTEGRGGNRGFRSTENDQGVLGELLENPNAASYSVGRLFFDRSYVAKWTTTYQAPHDLSVAVVARYQDGQPFSRFVVATGLAQGPEAVAAYRSGRTRFTFTATADLRVEKGVRVRGHRAAVRVDVFNLSNDANEVEENPVTGSTFRQSTRLQPPRTVRMGFRFEF